MVFNIAEGLNGFGREALAPALLDDYGIPYTFSDPLVLTLTLHKAMAKANLVRTVEVKVAGEGDAWISGQPVQGGSLVVPEGEHLVQVARGAVMEARFVYIDDGYTLTL